MSEEIESILKEVEEIRKKKESKLESVINQPVQS
jgi:hypothetical protein